tara:strand:+ start:421 stop:1596 length:1176 start_codon:yes stop_codon:yes gene_type:complete
MKTSVQTVPGTVDASRILLTDDYGSWAVVPKLEEELWVSTTGWSWQYDIRLKQWFRPSKNPPNSITGDVMIGHRGKDLRVHRLMALAFFGPPPTPDHTVDHLTKYAGDLVRERSDNRIENLRWASKVEQALNRNKQKPRRDGRVVLAWRIGTDAADAVSYSSSLAASKALGVNAGSVSRTANRGIEYKTNGWHFRFAETHEPLRITEDEEFREVDGFHVSQYGRALDPQTNTFAFTPKANKGLMYAVIQRRSEQGKPAVRRQFHRLVAMAFPEIAGVPLPDQVVVDHQNRNRYDNRATNLKWATVAENNTNRTPTNRKVEKKWATPVEMKPPEATTWLRFGSQCEAVQQVNLDFGTKLTQTTVSDSLKMAPSGRTINKGKHKGWSIRAAHN